MIVAEAQLSVYVCVCVCVCALGMDGWVRVKELTDGCALGTQVLVIREEGFKFSSKVVYSGSKCTACPQKLQKKFKNYLCFVY